uniref:Abortive infection protein-like C-terminal domain-containing protein n=1 Tax=mine drainage metagenome TaxID=410659 RepID=E6PH05_9ZZZZ
MAMSVPRVDLFVDGNPGQIVACIECDVVRRLSGITSTFGAILRLPVEKVNGYAGTIVMLSGILRLSGEHEGITIPAQPFVKNDTMLRVPFSEEQLVRLEERRLGAQICFELALRGVGVIGSQTVALVPNFHSANLVVPVEEWLTVLEQMGFGRRRLIELPPAPARKGEAWEEASKQIQEASRRLASADPGAAMIAARIALERTLEAVGDFIGRPRTEAEAYGPFAKALSEHMRSKHLNRSDDPYGVLADTIQVAISCFGFSSDPAHNALDSAERVHAELAISIATSIFTYFGRMLR